MLKQDQLHPKQDARAHGQQRRVLCEPLAEQRFSKKCNKISTTAPTQTKGGIAGAVPKLYSFSRSQFLTISNSIWVTAFKVAEHLRPQPCLAQVLWTAPTNTGYMVCMGKNKRDTDTSYI